MTIPTYLTDAQKRVLIALHECGAYAGGDCAQGVKLHQIGGERGSMHHGAAKPLQPIFIARRSTGRDWGAPLAPHGTRTPSLYRLTAYGARVGSYLRAQALVSADMHKSLPASLAASPETSHQEALQG